MLINSSFQPHFVNNTTPARQALQSSKQPGTNNSNGCSQNPATEYAKVQPNHFSALNISFLGSRKYLTLQEQMDRLIPDNLEANILYAINTELRFPDTNKTLYDIHREIYGPLLDCKTLDEAKALYPEFQYVIDAKDVKPSEMSPTMIKIKNGEIDGIKLEDLTLECLKRHYGKGSSPNAREAFFGLSKDATFKIFKILQIRRLNGKYLRLLGDCSPDKRQRSSEGWTEEKRAAHAKTANEIWSDPKKRQTQSDTRKQWFKDHPEAAVEISERMQGMTLSDDTKTKISISKKQFYTDNPEFAQLRSESFKRHEEFTKTMSEIAKNEFPYLRIIFLKTAEGVPLNEYETRYMERYHKRCEEVFPNGQKQVGQTFSAMWAEFKKEKEDK